MSVQTRTGGRVTGDELSMIRDAMLSPHMMTMVDRAIELLDSERNPLNSLFRVAAQAMLDQIHRDNAVLRKELKARQIKLHDEHQEGIVIYVRYICRGYEDRLGVVREVARAEISIRMGKYIQAMAGRLKNL
ncbi:hypothetical protein [Cohnella nanjingensis]|uniref:Uncharacterized protein n=1 Tax=Cohnella nanjingensis TaxID=1387779 RepID=A0A7X0RMK1_9BACL|nr:hypothetical protein [Cohnella nanjingensis]MBB6670302.1 hypothetical protein [Cohnella nanjingensis]